MADDLDVLRQEIERKSLELEAMKKLLELKVSTLKCERIYWPINIYVRDRVCAYIT